MKDVPPAGNELTLILVPPASVQIRDVQTETESGLHGPPVSYQSFKLLLLETQCLDQLLARLHDLTSLL